MLRIIKWLFYGFIFVFLWQISKTMDDNREQMNNTTIRLGDTVEESINDVIKQSKDNVLNVQKDLAESVKQAGQQYIKEIMK